jgi:hypothetical protein
VFPFDGDDDILLNVTVADMHTILWQEDHSPIRSFMPYNYHPCRSEKPFPKGRLIKNAENTLHFCSTETNISRLSLRQTDQKTMQGDVELW